MRVMYVAYLAVIGIGLLFLAALVGQAFAGWHQLNDELVWLVQRGSPESKPLKDAGQESDEKQKVGAYARPD